MVTSAWIAQLIDTRKYVESGNSWTSSWRKLVEVILWPKFGGVRGYVIYRPTTHRKFSNIAIYSRQALHYCRFRKVSPVPEKDTQRSTENINAKNGGRVSTCFVVLFLCAQLSYANLMLSVYQLYLVQLLRTHVTHLLFDVNKLQENTRKAHKLWD